MVPRLTCRRWPIVQAALWLCACRGEVDRSRPPSATSVTQSLWVLEADSLRALAVGAEAPDGATAIITVESDQSGRVLRHVEEPISESGDWSLTLTHTFDTSGAVTRYESVGRYFSPDSSCSRVVQDHRTWVRRPRDDGWDSTRTLSGQAGTVVSDENCGHAYAFFAGQRFERYAELVAGHRAPRRR